MEEELKIFNDFLDGSPEACNLLLKKYHNYLVIVGVRYLKDKARANDVIHDIFSDLWKTDREILVKSSVKAYLRGAMINKCLSIKRKDLKLVFKNDIEEKVDRFTPQDMMEENELKLIIKNVISDLPPKCREVYKLSRDERKSHKEISEILNISTKTIENHIHRALRDIRRIISDYGIFRIILVVGLGELMTYWNIILTMVNR